MSRNCAVWISSFIFFFFSSRRRHTRSDRDWSSDVCSSDLLCVTVGKDRTEVPELHAGDIGVVAKLRDTHTNDTLSTKDHAIVLPKIPFPEPVITEAIEVKQRGEEEKLSNGLH